MNLKIRWDQVVTVRRGEGVFMSDHARVDGGTLKPHRDERRAALRDSGDDSGAADLQDNSLGLAFSGGGIRSATISLGAAQVLARHGRWFDFDYLSTVSGGGYTGSFLTSLFMHDGQRGLGDPDGAAAAGPAAPEPNLRAKREFGLAALKATTSERDLHSPAYPGRTLRNPVWWLREHGRYLAPNGTTDYVQAAFYMIRNWFAMLYVFALPLMVFFLLVTAIAWWALINPPDWLTHWHPGGWAVDLDLLRVGGGQLPVAPCGCSHPGHSTEFLWSPVLLLVPLALYFAGAAGTGYWLTEGAPIASGGVWMFGARRNVRLVLAFYIIATALSAAGAAYLAFGSGQVLPRWLARLPILQSLPLPISTYLHLLMALGLALALGGALLATIAAPWTDASQFSQKVRAKLTAWGSRGLLSALVLLFLGLIDTVALLLRAHLIDWFEAAPISVSLLPAVGGAAAWLFNLVSSKAPDKDGGRFAWISRHFAVAALIAGGLLYALFAVMADVVVQFAIWEGIHRPPYQDFDRQGFHIVLATLAVLFILTGRLTGFINLSSLNDLYRSRLSRTYLGGTNVKRLADPASRITDVDPKDFIDIHNYQAVKSGAPLHLINATLNETLSADRSNLADRDRKGVPITFGPEGVFVNAARTDGTNGYKSWDRLRESDSESLSVGQLCAISGAAASSGMGARTTLGTALALTFANVRLGYWWDSRELFSDPDGPHLPMGGTYHYLLAEMLGRYSRGRARVYLTDGGHFENSGVYELLRRKTRVIVVCDNGADPDYQFEDLQNLVRKARIDLGLDVRVASRDNVELLVGRAGADLFLNAPGGKWRDNARSRDSSGIALLLEVGGYDDKDQRRFTREGRREHEGTAYIVWIKPTIFPEMSEDLIGYSVANPAFPQQTTSDQFFDEAQWESYRMVGAMLMNRLLNETPHKEDLFRVIAAASRG